MASPLVSFVQPPRTTSVLWKFFPFLTGDDGCSQEIDGLIEEERDVARTTSGGSGKIGTTKRGIGPTYAAKASRTGFRVADLYSDWGDFSRKFEMLVARYRIRFPKLEVDVPATLAKTKELAERLKPFVVDTVTYVNGALNKKKILVEGANALMLDLDFGTYPYVFLFEAELLSNLPFPCPGTYPSKHPDVCLIGRYVTSSATSAGGVSTGLGIPPRFVKQVFGVVKAYSTRVGAGAFPTELS